MYSYKLGDPHDESTTTGPVISAPSKVKIQSHIDDALSKGAVNVTPENASFALATTALEGNWVAPIVLTNVNHDMITMKEETFGPVMPIMKVSSDEEAIALINDSDYGLTTSVWTRDLVKGEELIDQIEAGTVFLNRCDYPAPVSAYITLYLKSSQLILFFYRIWHGLDGRALVLAALSDLEHTMDSRS